jgi:hypothetical protein
MMLEWSSALILNSCGWDTVVAISLVQHVQTCTCRQCAAQLFDRQDGTIIEDVKAMCDRQHEPVCTDLTHR